MNSQQHKRITLKDISEQCGYSVNTVSRALRDDPRLPEATISRIKQVADELGYMSLFHAFRSHKPDCRYC